MTAICRHRSRWTSWWRHPLARRQRSSSVTTKMSTRFRTRLSNTFTSISFAFPTWYPTNLDLPSGDPYPCMIMPLPTLGYVIIQFNQRPFNLMITHFSLFFLFQNPESQSDRRLFSHESVPSCSWFVYQRRRSRFESFGASRSPRSAVADQAVTSHPTCKFPVSKHCVYR